MGNNNYCVFKFQKKVFKPCNRFNIKTVCRFIKKQNVWVSKNCLSKKNTYLLTFIKVTHHFVMIFFFKSKTRKHLFNLIFSFISANLTKFSLHFCSLHTVFVRKIFFCIDIFDCMRKLIKLWKSHHYSIFYGIFIVGKVILL